MTKEEFMKKYKKYIKDREFEQKLKMDYEVYNYLNFKRQLFARKKASI